MPYQFDFDTTNRILRGSLNGRVTDELLKEYYRLAAQYAVQFDPHSGITDLSGVTSFEVSPETIRELARSAPAMPDSSRPRVVIAPTDYIFGMARMFQLEGENTRPNNHVVRTLRAALDVLGVRDTQFEGLPTSGARDKPWPRERAEP